MTVSNLLGEISERRACLFGNRGKFLATEFGKEILNDHAEIFARRKDSVKPDLCRPPIHSQGTPWLNGAMNKFEYRKRWLRALQEQEGGVNELAEKIGTDPNYLSSILGISAKRNVGDELARRTEEAFSLPYGVLDFPSVGAQKIARAAEGMDDDAIEDVITYINFRKSKKDTT